MRKGVGASEKNKERLHSKRGVQPFSLCFVYSHGIVDAASIFCTGCFRSVCICCNIFALYEWTIFKSTYGFLAF